MYKNVAIFTLTSHQSHLLYSSQAIAQAVGIPAHRILARAKPDDKKGFIEYLQSSHRCVRGILCDMCECGVDCLCFYLYVMCAVKMGALYLWTKYVPDFMRRDGSHGKLNVAFVGDGTNDSPALAVAQVSWVCLFLFRLDRHSVCS